MRDAMLQTRDYSSDIALVVERGAARRSSAGSRAQQARHKGTARTQQGSERHTHTLTKAKLLSLVRSLGKTKHAKEEKTGA